MCRWAATMNMRVGRNVPRDTTAQAAPSRPHSARQKREAQGPRVTRAVGDRIRTTTHSLREVAGFLFCIRCGCYSARRARGLQQACGGRATLSRARALRLLLRGCHPRSGERLGYVESTRFQSERNRLATQWSATMGEVRIAVCTVAAMFVPSWRRSRLLT